MLTWTTKHTAGFKDYFLTVQQRQTVAVLPPQPPVTLNYASVKWMALSLRSSNVAI